MDAKESSIPVSPEDSKVVEGERLGSLIKVKPEYRERYIALHAHPFPEVLNQLHKSNVRNYSIFLRDGLLFSFQEYNGSDFDRDMEKVEDNSAVQDWWTLTDPMQEPLEDYDSGEWWTSMEEVYHGGRKTMPSSETTRRAYLSRLQPGARDKARGIYANAATLLTQTLKDLGVQNYVVYVLGHRLCTYFEHTGDDASVERLEESSAMQEVSQALSPLLVDGSATIGYSSFPMRSVFYMP